MTNTTTHKLLLVVEDEARMMKLLKESLEHEGFAVQQAVSGEVALARAESVHPDLVLLDIMLPGMDGMSMLKTLREREWGKKIPVIILTNISPDENIMTGVMRDGPSYYIIKANTSMDDIVAKVKNVLALVPSQGV